MNKILNQSEIDRIFMMYLPCMATCQRHEDFFLKKYLSYRDYIYYGSDYMGNPKLHLTPLAKMPDEHIFELCKVASEETYGDFRYSKWCIERDVHNNGKDWENIYVKNKNSDKYFQIDLIDGDVRIWYKEGNEIDNMSLNHTYWQWYLKQEYAIRIYPYGETPIELGIAIDKTLKENVIT